MHKDLRKMVKALEAQGFTVLVTAKQHVMVSKDGRLIATFSGTASDWRSIRNTLGPLKRAGFRWPPST